MRDRECSGADGGVMYVLGYLLLTVAKLTGMLINLVTIVIIIAAIVSWVNADPYNPVVRVLRSLTEPVYYRIRKWLPFVFVGGLDLSPLVLLLALQLVNGVVVQSVHEFGRRLLL